MTIAGLVSIVIPTFNRSRLCQQAVRSVLSQTYQAVEVIVVDDGSTDDTKETISGIDPRVRYIRQDNAGVSVARNTGLAAATGEYIAFLDSDDVWLPWKVEAQLAVLRRFESAGMVWTDMKAVSETGATVSASYLAQMYAGYKYFERERAFGQSESLGAVWSECPAGMSAARCYCGNIFPWMFMGNLVHTSTVLVRRGRQRAVGEFDASLHESGEDYDFHLRTTQLGDVAYIDVASIEYRVGASDQLTSPEHIVWIARNNLRTVMKAYQSAGGQIPLPAPLVRRHMADAESWVGITELASDRLSARSHFAASLAIIPWQPRVWAYLLASFVPGGVF